MFVIVNLILQCMWAILNSGWITNEVVIYCKKGIIIMAFGNNFNSIRGIPEYFLKGITFGGGEPDDLFMLDYQRYSGAILPNIIGKVSSVLNNMMLPDTFLLKDISAKTITTRDPYGGQIEYEPVQIETDAVSWSYTGNYICASFPVDRTAALDYISMGEWSAGVNQDILNAISVATDQQVFGAFLGSKPAVKNINMYEDISIKSGIVEQKEKLTPLPMTRYIPIDWDLGKDEKAPAGNTFAGQQLTEAKIRAVSKALGATGASGEKILIVPASLMTSLTYDARAWDKNNAMFLQPVIHRVQYIMVHDVLVVGVPDNHFPTQFDEGTSTWYQTRKAHLLDDLGGTATNVFGGLPVYETNNPQDLRVTYGYGFIRNRSIKWAEYVNIASGGASQDAEINRAYQSANPGAGLIRPPVAPGMRLAPKIEYGDFGEEVKILYKNMYGWARTHDENVCIVELNCGYKPATHV